MKMLGSATLHEGKTHILQWFIPLLTEHFTTWLAAIQNIHSHVHLPQEIAFCNSYPVQQDFWNHTCLFKLEDQMNCIFVQFAESNPKCHC